MKRSSKTWLSLLLTLLLLLGCVPAVYADDAPAVVGGTEDSGLIDAAELDSWMEEYVAQNGLNGDYQVFSVGFC